MKRTAFKLLMLLMIISAVCFCTACGNDSSEETVSRQSSSEPESTDVSEEPEPPTLLKSTFGTLYSGETYAIETDITVESALAPASGNHYHLKIAVDKTVQKAMLYMNIEDGSVNHIIIKDGQSYNLNDTDKNYTVQVFEDSIDLFAKLYTSELYIGLTEPLEMTESGEKKITLNGKEQTAAYEKYKMVNQEETYNKTEEAYITYYFIKGQPCMETMETASGKTTFVFQNISDKITDKTIFDIPAEYERV